MGKNRVGRYSNEFWRMAVERLKQCDNVVALAEELGIHRRLLYGWRDRLEAAETGDEPPDTSRDTTLRKEIHQLERLWAEKMLSVGPTGTA